MYYVPEDKLGSYEQRHVLSLAEQVETLDIDDGDRQSTELFEMIRALMFLKCEGLDEAHNIVTPHSWSNCTSFSGPPIRDSTVRREATYIHALIHRGEGDHQGEYGNGFQNSSFWFGQVSSHPVYELLPSLAQKLGSSDKQVAEHVALQSCGWKPTEFLTFCESSLHSKNPAQITFCEELINSEWDAAFDHAFNHLQSDE